jgi:hypothetical protein
VPSRTTFPRLAALAATAVLAGLVLLTGVVPAGAGSATTMNACLYSADNYYRDLEVTLTGTGSPNPLPPGQSLTTAVRLDGAMPSWLPQYGYNFGFLQVGENHIPTTIWVAIEATNTSEGAQVVQVQVDAVTMVEDPDGVVNTNDETGTPPQVSVDLPPMTWTATGGPVELGQAGGGALPTLPGAGARGDDATPEGSVFISAQLDTRVFNLDCQPGEYTQQGESFTPAVAAPFETVTEGTAPTSSQASTTSTTSAPTTSSAAPGTTAVVDGDLASSEGESSSSSPALPIAIAVVVVAALAGGGAWWARSRRQGA